MGSRPLIGRVDYRALAEPEEGARPGDGSAAELEPPKSLPPPSPDELRAALAKLVAIPTRRAPLLRRRRDARRIDDRRRALRAHARSIRGSSRRFGASSTPRSASLDGDIAPADAARGQAPRLLRRADRASSPAGCEDDVRAVRATTDGIRPVYARVDTCAAEFVAHTPYMYSTYESESESAPTAERSKVVILGGGPNRIGQGIEFDYCCVHAVLALRELGFETVMVNCNPETVSTDYDTSDRLYFEPLTLEDVLAICDEERRSPTASSCSSAGRRR